MTPRTSKSIEALPGHTIAGFLPLRELVPAAP
jgi:hypothetical protein